jgi:hypothetical protein
VVTPPTPTITGATEEYDGQLGQIQDWFKYSKNYLAGCGTQTAALAFGGTTPTGATEEYDGTTWTSGGSLNTARRFSRSRNSNSSFSFWW